MILLTTLAASGACERAMSRRGRDAVRLSAGSSDTVIVHFRSPQPLPIQALDAEGQPLTNAPIRMEWIGGDSMPLTEAGVLTCDRHGTVRVRATVARLTASYVVLCRPVEYVDVAGPLQFVLGDSLLSRPQALHFSGLDSARRVVSPLAGQLTVEDAAVAGAEGTSIAPRSRGVTLVSVTLGGRDEARGVHVYQRFDSASVLDTALRVDRSLRQFAIPLQLAPGESRHFTLPPGQWMLTTQAVTPEGPKPFKLRIENARCRPNLLNDPGRFGCDHPGAPAEVYVSRSAANGAAARVAGYLLVRWMY